MKEAVPNYYHKFRCIADRCTHNCCIGWEIDIDEDTMRLYNSMDTQIGERIRLNIEGDVPHFVLDEERCPFLNKNGLCDIICECGEEALCDICRLHPRFRSFYSSFFETGLGLCCEEAARIILSEKEPFSVNVPDVDITNEEREFFDKRQEIFCILQNRALSMNDRFVTLAEAFGLKFNYSLRRLCELYLSLERLDENWTDILDGLKNYSFRGTVFDDEKLQTVFEQLSVYFIFRHLGDAMWDGDYKARVNFALMSSFLIGSLCEQYIKENGSISLPEIAEFARMYSAEIEYSEENPDVLMMMD